MGNPTFQYATLADTDPPGSAYGRRLLFRSNTVPNTGWDISANVIGLLQIQNVAGIWPGSSVIDIDPTYVSIGPYVIVQSNQECSAPGTGAIRTFGGIWAAKNIRSGGNVRGASFTMASSSAECYDQAGSVTTFNNVATSILGFATAINYAYAIKVLVTYSKASDGSTGLYSFEYKCKNIGGVVTNSSPILTASAIDAGLAGTSVGIGLAGATTVVVATGLPVTTIQWGAKVQVVAIPV